MGQLVREHAGSEAVLVGFTTHTGTVTAANDWGSPAEAMRVRPLSHYFTVRLSQQFDAVIHLDRTTAVEPLDSSPGWSKPLEAPETYPSGV